MYLYKKILWKILYKKIRYKKIMKRFSTLNIFNSVKVSLRIKIVTLHVVMTLGKTSTSFRIWLKPDAEMQTQKPTKVSMHYRKKLDALL